MRHIGAYADGENLDGETGLSHLAHARCCLGFLLDYEVEHPELDDRRKRSVKQPFKPYFVTSLSVVRDNLDKLSMQDCVPQMSLFPELQ
jgi:hypothetical protein